MVNPLQRLASLLLLGGLLLPAAAYAQEDELAFRDYWNTQYKQRQRSGESVAPYAAPATPEVGRNGPCDLVSNGDLEAQVRVSDRINNLGGGLPNMTWPNNPVPSHLQNWVSPTGATPDYYAHNATDATARPATAVYGPFVPFAGQGSIGLFARMQYVDADGYNRDRVAEYVESRVAVAANVAYYGQLWVELTRNTGAANCGINNGFGFQLSNGRLPGATNTMRNFLTPTNRGVLTTQPINQGFVDNWQRIGGVFVPAAGDNTLTVGFFNSAPANYPALPGRSTAIPNTYVFMDNVELFRIPTAGPNVACSERQVQIGEGCAIPEARYEWRVRGSSAVFATSLLTAVAPTATTTYELTVVLPNGATHTTATVVTACPTQPICPPGSGMGGQLALTTQLGPIAYPPNSPNHNNYDDYCYSQAFTFEVTGDLTIGATSYTWQVDGYDVSSGNEVYGYSDNGPTMSFTPITTAPGRTRNVTVTCTITYDSPTCAPSAAYRSFMVASGDEDGNSCVMYRGTTPPVLSSQLAYPNPAVDFLTLPTGMDRVELVNQAGHPVLTSQQALGGRFNVQALPDGLYLLRTVRKGKVATQRIQIKH